jgi:high-affinity iron transporter
MLLNSVILILREVLEAAILVSVLLALSRNLGQPMRWLWWSLPLGALGAFWFASSMGEITDALDGAGQEVANAGLQLMVYCFTTGILAMSARGEGGADGRWLGLRVLMTGAVACAVIREGSEILLYITGFAASEEHRTAVFAGSAIGAGIGISLGILMFSALRALSAGVGYRSCIGLLCLIGAGMVMQATMLLEQVDWLPAGLPLWDSSALVSEQSIAGELLYAVFGYESTPSGIQVLLYSLSLLLMLAVYALARLLRSADNAN